MTTGDIGDATVLSPKSGDKTVASPMSPEVDNE